MSLMNRVEVLLGKQYRCPTGLLGHVVGNKMARQHAPETTWTLSLLDMKPADRVLEIGFGVGRAIELIAAQIPRCSIAGIDLSPTMVQASRRRNAQAIKAGRVDARQGTVERLPFQGHQFDKLFSIHSLYFWPDMPRSIAEIARVLRPGGLLALTFSPGQVDAEPDKGVQQMVEQIITHLKQMGFISADLQSGPHSRQFQTAAIIGVKGAGDYRAPFGGNRALGCASKWGSTTGARGGERSRLPQPWG